MTWTIHEGDCLDVMRGMPEGIADVVITDPPYNVGLRYEGDDSGDRRADYAAWSADWWQEARRLAATVAMTPGTPNVSMWLAIQEPDLWLCNYRPNGRGYSKAGFCHWEPILVWGDVRGQRSTDVIRAPIVHEPSCEPHPCPKPVEWGVQLVRLLCPPGGLVLDPFMGSGTTGVACIREGAEFIGIERESEYAEIARRRIMGAEGVHDEEITVNGKKAVQGGLFS